MPLPGKLPAMFGWPFMLFMLFRWLLPFGGGCILQFMLFRLPALLFDRLPDEVVFRLGVEEAELLIDELIGELLIDELLIGALLIIAPFIMMPLFMFAWLPRLLFRLLHGIDMFPLFGTTLFELVLFSLLPGVE